MKTTGNELTVTTNQVCGNSFQHLLLGQQFVVVVTKEGSKHANQCFNLTNIKCMLIVCTGQQKVK
jgi:hypothetical protein